MAATTYNTTTFLNNQPKSVVSGLTVQKFTFTSTTTTSVSDVVYLAKLPNRAKIVDLAVEHTSAETALGIDYGLANGHTNGGSASYSCFISAGAKGSVNRISQTLGGRVQISLSANDIIGYGILAARIASGSASTAFSIDGYVVYTLDDPR